MERVGLVGRGKFKVLVKFVVLVAVALVVIGGYGEQVGEGKEEGVYGVVEVHKVLMERLTETEEGEIVVEGFVQELGHRVEKVMKKHGW